MSPAIFAVSRLGLRTARLLAAGFDGAVVYAPTRFAGQASLLPAVAAYEGSPAPLIAQEFERRRPLVLVMAAGAAVRMIAPLLMDKLSDPAIVVVDDAGRYAISLVSGHAGGANDLARQVASVLGSEAIITTAAERAGLPAVEQVARDQGWWIEPGSSLTRLAASLINGDAAGLFQDAGDDSWLDSYPPDSFTRYRSVDALCAADVPATLVVTDRLIELPKSIPGQFAVCRPPVLVLGVGCSTGVTTEEIGALVDATLTTWRLSPLSLFALATIDRRRTDPCLIAFAKDRRLQVTDYSAAELESTPGNWTRSETVRRAVGTGGVAEPAALRCAGATSLVVPKATSKHVTVAVARVPGHNSSDA